MKLAIVELFPGALIGIFGAANESAYYTAFAIKAFRIYLCMMIFGSGGRTIGRKDAAKGCCVWLSGKGRTLNFVRRIIRNIC